MSNMLELILCRSSFTNQLPKPFLKAPFSQNELQFRSQRTANVAHPQKYPKFPKLPLQQSNLNHNKCIHMCSKKTDFDDLYKEEFDELPAAISVENLMVNFKGPDGAFPVLKNCTLRIPEGKFWMLLGPNGCGKSTLLKVLAGLVRPSGGRMRVKVPRSFVFQNPDHQVIMPTVGADVAFGLGKQNLPESEVKSRVENCLKSVNMESYIQRSIQTLSGGQKQRVAIAGALAENSKVLLLDELTTFLDVHDQLSVLETVKKVVEENDNVTALWITHRLEELSFADGASYMDDGRIIMSGKVAKVQDYVKRLQEK